MAYELAEQRDKDGTIALLDLITQSCSNGIFITDAWLTKARLYFNVTQYDSTIYCTDVLSFSYDYKEPACFVLKAQAFDRLGVIDSALYYANYVLSLPTASYQDIYNMLYITTHYNPDIENTELLEITSHRADIGLALDNNHARHAQASEILRQDIKRKTNWMWLYAVCLTLIVTGICLWGYIWKKRRQHQLLSQQVSELENIRHTAKQQHEQIVQEHAEYKNSIVAQIENTCDVFCKSSHLQKDLCWSDYNQMCEIVNQHFFFFAQKLQNTHLLTEREIRLCILVLIGITNSKQLADMLLYSESGIRNFKNRTAKKLNTNSVELRSQLLKIVSGE
jgi:DNA-binding CsgD family transcriptional regulator